MNSLSFGILLLNILDSQAGLFTKLDTRQSKIHEYTDNPYIQYPQKRTLKPPYPEFQPPPPLASLGR